MNPLKKKYIEKVACLEKLEKQRLQKGYKKKEEEK